VSFRSYVSAQTWACDAAGAHCDVQVEEPGLEEPAQLAGFDDYQQAEIIATTVPPTSDVGDRAYTAAWEPHGDRARRE
jgi:hypothetical protein